MEALSDYASVSVALCCWYDYCHLSQVIKQMLAQQLPLASYTYKKVL